MTIEKRIPEYAVTEDADETWETLPIEQLSSELERYCGVAVRTRRVLTATDEADAGANAAEKREMRAWVRVRVRVRRQR